MLSGGACPVRRDRSSRSTIATSVRIWLPTLVLFVLATAALAAGSKPAESCDPAMRDASNNCIAPKQIHQAEESFRRGLKLQKDSRPADAFDAFDRAATLQPRNLEYATAREVALEKLVYAHMEKGNALMAEGRQIRALGEFRAALVLDPENSFALQRVKDALGDHTPQLKQPMKVVAEADQISAEPLAVRRDFKYRGETKGLIESIVRAFGLTVVFDDSVQAKPIRFDLENVDFGRAMQLACTISKTFWTPLAEGQIYVAADTAANRKMYERVSLRTYYVPTDTPQQLNDIVNALRTIFEVRLLTIQPAKSLITVRAPRATVDAVTRFLEGISGGKPQVMLEVQVFEISRNSLRNLGINVPPPPITVFNIPSVVASLAQQPNVQDLINQLIASGGINQANTVAIAALLAQLQQQNSPLLQSFAAFGGGKTLEGVVLPKLSANVFYDDTHFSSLEHMTLRAAQNNAATFFVGERFPVLNAIFSPILNSPAVAQVIQNGSFTAPFPSFTYEDLGLTVKATPHIHNNSDVTLDFELQTRQLTGQAFNGVPVLGSREYKGGMTLKDGEPAVVVSSIDTSSQAGHTGVPFFGAIPGFGLLVSSTAVQTNSAELIVVITPHVLDLPQHVSDEGEIWLSPSRTQ